MMVQSIEAIRTEIREYLVKGYSVLELEKVLPHIPAEKIREATGQFRGVA